MHEQDANGWMCWLLSLSQTLALVWLNCQTDTADEKWENAGRDPWWGRILRKLANCVTFDDSFSKYKLFVGVSRRLWLNYRPKKKKQLDLQVGLDFWSLSFKHRKPSWWHLVGFRWIYLNLDVYIKQIFCSSQSFPIINMSVEFFIITCNVFLYILAYICLACQ